MGSRKLAYLPGSTKIVETDWKRDLLWCYGKGLLSGLYRYTTQEIL